MSISYSAAAAQTAPTPSKTDQSSTQSTEETVNEPQSPSVPRSQPKSNLANISDLVQPEAGPSKPRIKHLILDAGPLLSLTPLRHLAESFYTTPAVLAELRDPKAREHWENLGLSGVDVKVEQPRSEWMAKGKLSAHLRASRGKY